MRRKLTYRIVDWWAARIVGRAIGEGVAFGDEGQPLPHHERIEAQQDQQKTAFRQGIDRQRDRAEQTKGAAMVKRGHAARELEKLQPIRAAKARSLAACSARVGPRQETYSATLVALVLASLPVDWTMASVLPMPLVLQILLTASIGIGLCFAAHLAAKKINEVVIGWPERRDEASQFVQSLVAAIASLAGPQAVIITFGQLRAENLTLIETLVADTSATTFQPATINNALLAFQMLIFLAAIVVGLRYAEAEPRRILERAIRELDTEMATHQAVSDAAEVTIRVAEETLRQLVEREKKGLEAIDGETAARRARFDHICRKYATQRARKRARKGPLASQAVGALALALVVAVLTGCGGGDPSVVALIADVSPSAKAYRGPGGLYEQAAVRTAEHAAIEERLLFAAPATGNSIAEGAWMIDGESFPTRAAGGNEKLARAERLQTARKLRPRLRELLATHGGPGSDLLGALANAARLFDNHPGVEHELVLLTDGGINVGGVDLYHDPPRTEAERRQLIRTLQRAGRLPDLSGDGRPVRVWVAGLGLGAPSRVTANAIVEFWSDLVPAVGGELVAADSTLRLPAVAV